MRRGYRAIEGGIISGIDDNPGTGTRTRAAGTGADVDSPHAKELFRRGAVYTLAGVLRAADVTIAAARGAVRGAKEGAASASSPSSATSVKPKA
jgi:hypothetical protein